MSSIVIGTNAPTRCPCCGGTEFSDGPVDYLTGAFACRTCGKEIAGAPIYETVQTKAVVLDLACACGSLISLYGCCVNCGRAA